MTSPASSGPAGSLFEGQVGGSYLLSLLLDVDARGVPGCRIHQIQFQRADESNPLDDVIVKAHDKAGRAATLEVQVKRSITFAPKDPVFRKVTGQIKEATDEPGFWSSNHQLAIAIARTTERIEKSYQDVLTWARNFESSAAFHARLARPGAGNDPMSTFVETFRNNLRECGEDSDDEFIWQLLRRLQILVFDFTAIGSASVELMQERAVRALHPSHADQAGNLWTTLTKLSLETAASGGEISREALVEELQKNYSLAARRVNFQALDKLAEDSELALSDIEDRVSGVRLQREKRVEAVRNALESKRYVEIRGDSGVGKSGILRHLAEELGAEAPVLIFSPIRTTPGGWGKFRDSIGYDGTCRELLTDLSLSGSAVLFIDNLDFFSPEAKSTVNDFVRIATSIAGISVIATARTEFGLVEPNWLSKESLAALGQAPTVFIPDLDEAEVDELRAGANRLSQLLSDSHPAKPIVRNLFRLSRLVNRDEAQPWPATEAEMARQWWSDGDGRADSLLRDRRRVLYRMAEHYLVSIEPYHSRSELAAALDSLIKSGTLRELRLDSVAFRHDVLREWAVGSLLSESPELIPKLPLEKRAPLDLDRGVELAARLAIENASDAAAWLAILGPVSQRPTHQTWRRAVLLSLVRSEISIRLIRTSAAVLLAEDAFLLRDLIRYVLAVEFESFGRRAKARGLEVPAGASQLRVPRNSSPMYLIMGLLVIHQYIPAIAIPEVAKLYSSYLMGTWGGDGLAPLILPKIYEWLLAIDQENEANPYGFVNRIFDGKLQEHQLKVLEGELRTSLVFFCDRTPQLAADYLTSFHGRVRSRDTRRSILEFRGKLAEVAPKELVDFTIETLIPPTPRRRDRSGLFPERPFENADIGFQPASPAQGPFLELLVASPEQGLRLVRHLVEYEVRFYRANTQDAHAIPILFSEQNNTFPWQDFYYWSRDYGNASATIVSALMALEAWAHKRIDEGETVEDVLADILATPSMSCAVLLVAIDVVLSHWPESAEAAIPLFASPELLCLEMTRDRHDNTVVPDFLGLKEIQKEPIGRVTLESLKQRTSRRTNLYKVLSQYTFGPKEANLRLRSLLQRAAERLGPPEVKSDLGDPRQMVRHALNTLSSENWANASLPQPNGEDRPVIVYQEPPAEAAQMEPIRSKARPRLAESSLCIEIQAKLASTTPCTPEFIEQAIAWADRHVSVLDRIDEFDTSGERSSTTESVVVTAWLIARDGTNDLIRERGDWMRTVFIKAFAGNDEPSFMMRSGLSMNPRAIAFVGQTLLLYKDKRDGDFRLLLHFVVRSGYAAAHGFGVTIHALTTIHEHFVPAILRCAFLSAVMLDYGWRLTDEQKQVRAREHQAVLDAGVNEIANWLEGSSSEPAWPVFPLGRNDESDDQEEEAPRPAVHVNWQSAALWLKQAKPQFDPSKFGWPTEIVATYRNWTRDENGAGTDDKDNSDKSPQEWNEVYFDLESRCLSEQSPMQLDTTLESLLSRLPDNTLCSCVSELLVSVDRAYFERNALTAAQAAHIRANLIQRVQTTKLYGWNKDRDELSVTMYLAPALATIAFNDRGFRQSKCYLPTSFIEKADVFLPILETFLRDCTSPYLGLMYLNFMEVAPRPEHASFIATCSGIWLDRFPDSDRFWIEWQFGVRICTLLISIFQQAPEAFNDTVIPEVEHILSKLVSLGVPQAYELEQMIYYGQI